MGVVGSSFPHFSFCKFGKNILTEGSADPAAFPRKRGRRRQRRAISGGGVGRSQLWRRQGRRRRTVGQNQVILRHPIIHFPMSEGVSEVSEPVSAAEGASKASSLEQANEWAVRANERTDGPVHTSLFLFFPQWADVPAYNHSLSHKLGSDWARE